MTVERGPVRNGEEPATDESDPKPEANAKEDRVSTEGESNPGGFGNNVLSQLDSKGAATPSESDPPVRSTD